MFALRMGLVVALTSCSSFGQGEVNGAPDGGASTPIADAGVKPPAADAGPPPASMCTLMCGSRCVDPQRDRNNCGSCGVGCDPWAACEGHCVEVAGAVNGLREQIACTNDPAKDVACAVDQRAPNDVSATLTGSAEKTYEIVIHVRGVTEQRTYAGDAKGQAEGMMNSSFFAGGGITGTDTWNIFQIAISTPAATWHLNSGKSGNTYSDLLDYNATIQATGNAIIKLHADSGDAYQAQNRDMNGNPILTSLSPDPFHGQFVQLDVVSVSLVP